MSNCFLGFAIPLSGDGLEAVDSVLSAITQAIHEMEDTSCDVPPADNLFSGLPAGKQRAAAHLLLQNAWRAHNSEFYAAMDEEGAFRSPGGLTYQFDEKGLAVYSQEHELHAEPVVAVALINYCQTCFGTPDMGFGMAYRPTYLFPTDRYYGHAVFCPEGEAVMDFNPYQALFKHIQDKPNAASGLLSERPASRFPLEAYGAFEAALPVPDAFHATAHDALLSIIGNDVDWSIDVDRLSDDFVLHRFMCDNPEYEAALREDSLWREGAALIRSLYRHGVESGMGTRFCELSVETTATHRSRNADAGSLYISFDCYDDAKGCPDGDVEAAATLISGVLAYYDQPPLVFEWAFSHEQGTATKTPALLPEPLHGGGAAICRANQKPLFVTTTAWLDAMCKTRGVVAEHASA